MGGGGLCGGGDGGGAVVVGGGPTRRVRQVGRIARKFGNWWKINKCQAARRRAIAQIRTYTSGIKLDGGRGAFYITGHLIIEYRCDGMRTAPSLSNLFVRNGETGVEKPR